MHVEVKARYDHVLLIEGGTFILYALVALVFTRELLDLHGVELNDTGVFMARMAAGVFFAFSALNLMARKLTDYKALHMVADANLIKHIVCLIVATGSYFNGSAAGLGGIGFILLFSLFTIIFGYFHFSNMEYVRTLDEKVAA